MIKDFQKKYLNLTIIQWLIILAVTGILITFALSQYQRYAKKRYFSEVIKIAKSYKLAVETCYKNQTILSHCTNGSNGVPAAPAATEMIAFVVTTSGVISAKGQNGAGNDTYILTPTPVNNELVWSTSGTCITSGMC